MHAAAQHWLGKHDFRTFESRWPQRKSSVRTVLDISCMRLPPPDHKRIVLEVEADGFLYNMVRTMVGTLVEVGRGRRPPEWAAEVLAVGDRREAGMKVPPHGLFLMQVTYAAAPGVERADRVDSAEE
jgi:tRNA pseudouridine38-40 synthase